MSFQISVTPKRRAAARFVTDVRRKLLKVLADNPEVTQSDLARALEVNRSVICRQLNGRENISLGRVAELAWAMGYEPNFELVREPIADRSNHKPTPIVAGKRDQFVTQSSSASDVLEVTQEKTLADVL